VTSHVVDPAGQRAASAGAAREDRRYRSGEANAGVPRVSASEPRVCSMLLVPSVEDEDGKRRRASAKFKERTAHTDRIEAVLLGKRN
jgi:hypothetical protein